MCSDSIIGLKYFKEGKVTNVMFVNTNFWQQKVCDHSRSSAVTEVWRQLQQTATELR